MSICAFGKVKSWFGVGRYMSRCGRNCSAITTLSSEWRVHNPQSSIPGSTRTNTGVEISFAMTSIIE